MNDLSASGPSGRELDAGPVERADESAYLGNP